MQNVKEYNWESSLITLSETLHITIIIYLKKITILWIKENSIENQRIFYLEFTLNNQKLIDLEGHYITLIP